MPICSELLERAVYRSQPDDGQRLIVIQSDLGDSCWGMASAVDARLEDLQVDPLAIQSVRDRLAASSPSERRRREGRYKSECGPH